MAFEVTADPLATAYADTDTADTVAEITVGGSAWLDLDDEIKEQHLNTASRDIDSLDGQRDGEYLVRFPGARASTSQALEWPRTGTSYSATAWPQRLVDATVELAFYNARQLSANASLDVVNADPNAFRLKRSEVGPIKEEWFAPSDTAIPTGAERFPGIVQRLLVPLLNYTLIRNAWGGSATVSRAS